MIASGRHGDPFGVLGPHRDEATGGIVVRTRQPAARTVDVRLTTHDAGGLSARDVALATAIDA